MAAEWLVEARDGGTCVVRLIQHGFGSGAEWDAEYDATTEGWRLFLANLRLYLTHFPGQPCASVLVNGKAAGPVDRAFGELAGALGLPTGARKGDRVAATAAGAAAGRGGRAGRARHAHPAAGQAWPGVAFVVAEPAADGSAHASVYAYLFGEGAAEVAAREEPAVRDWMRRHFPARGTRGLSGRAPVSGRAGPRDQSRRAARGGWRPAGRCRPAGRRWARRR